jgi:predicted glycosyltransferase
MFAGQPIFRMNSFSRSYLAALRASRVAIGYGGYNTLTDLLWARAAAIIVTRLSADGEQALRAERMRDVFGSAAVWFHGSPSSSAISQALIAHLQRKRPVSHDVDIDGASRAATQLLDLC